VSQYVPSFIDDSCALDERSAERGSGEQGEPGHKGGRGAIIAEQGRHAIALLNNEIWLVPEPSRIHSTTLWKGMERITANECMFAQNSPDWVGRLSYQYP
jgi:hypothetical protein